MLIFFRVIHENNYVSQDGGLQSAGRHILADRDAVVIIPEKPFEVGKTYSVEVDVNGQKIQWSFETVSPPGTN